MVELELMVQSQPRVTISASSAVAPSPAACTVSGLTSISEMSGRARINRPIAMTAAATALISAGGCTAESVQELRGLEPGKLGGDLVFGEVGRHQPHVAQRFDPDAAEAQHQDRTPTPIAPRADHELEPRRHMASTSTPSSFSPGRARPTLACNVVQASPRASASAMPQMTPPASVLCAGALPAPSSRRDSRCARQC